MPFSPAPSSRPDCVCCVATYHDERLLRAPGRQGTRAHRGARSVGSTRAWHKRALSAAIASVGGRKRRPRDGSEIKASVCRAGGVLGRSAPKGRGAKEGTGALARIDNPARPARVQHRSSALRVAPAHRAIRLTQRAAVGRSRATAQAPTMGGFAHRAPCAALTWSPALALLAPPRPRCAAPRASHRKLRPLRARPSGNAPEEHGAEAALAAAAPKLHSGFLIT